ncbi:MAG: M23 family metallopeptidase [Bacteroidales bacterium]
MNKIFTYLKTWYARIFTNVRHKYRLVIMDERFHEKISFRLSRLNVLMGASMTVIALVALTTFLIAFTQMREYIPGYTNEKVSNLAYINKHTTDSLSSILAGQQLMLQIIERAINGDIPIAEAIHAKDSLKDYRNIDYQISTADALLRKEIENADKYNIGNTIIGNGTQGVEANSLGHTSLFYVPLQGRILKEFNAVEKHFGLKITGKQNDVIKSILDGTVIYADWTPENYYTIILQHDNAILSIYKLNSALLKKVGDFVKAGEVIAFIGNTPEHTSQPMLHFELWQNGSPVNPKDYILF